MLKVALNRTVEAFTQEPRRLYLSAYWVFRNLSTAASEAKTSVLEGMSHICNDDGVEHRVPCIHDGAAVDIP
ncbi:unnamed protein product [Taenia asiatica]|uniref:Transposase n=1 Tax=Taenia asiatica TaxID=60517 RepID=A0A0R3WGZ1_TAEAS|nr:unnamed protein product [Taenia asiatica]